MTRLRSRILDWNLRRGRPFPFLFLVFLLLPSSAFAADEPDVIAGIFERKANAVVLIAVEAQGGDKLGSGFLISRDGKIVTNYHLIKGARKVAVKLTNGLAYLPRRVVNLDPSKDIAVIQIDKGTPNYFAMGDSNKVIVGQRVLTIGNPQGLESTVSDGLVSAVRMSDDGLKMFQISVPLSNGSSGGPLIDLSGDVIGITTASLADGQNLNFAVPINYVRILLRKPFYQDRNQFMAWQGQTAPQPKPSPQTTSDHHTKPSSYIVSKGDSLFSIAKKFKVSVEDIKRVNDIKDPRIVPGQKLILP